MSLGRNRLSTVTKLVEVVVIVPKKRYQVRWDVYGALAGVERRVGNGGNYFLRCFKKYGFCDF